MNDLVERIKKYPKGSEGMVNSFQYNEGVRAAWTPIWVRNSHRSYSEIERRFARGNFDVATLKDKMKPGPCLVLGSGPSLEDARPYLKDWKGIIVCSTSHLPWFAHEGLEPDYCFLIDADPSMAYLVTDYVKPNWKTILLTHPQIPVEIIKAWPEDKVYFFRMLDPSDKFSCDYLPMAYGWVGGPPDRPIAIGSTILNGGNVVNSAIPFCQVFWKPIFLCGYDLGYPDNKRRASDWKVDPKTGEWTFIPAPPLTAQRWVEAVKVETNNGVPADELCSFYKTSTMIQFAMSAPPVISCSRGIVTEYPYVHPKEVIEKQGVGFDHLLIDHVTAYRAGQAFLRPRGFLIMKTDFWGSVSNVKGMKGWEKIRTILAYEWFIRKPWKWLGGKGYVPRRVKIQQRKQKRAEAKAKKEQEKKNVPRQ